MKKKLISLLAVMALTVGTLAGCGSSAEKPAESTPAAEDAAEGEETAAASTVKAGFIFLHDENSTYDLNFMNGAKEACEKMGIEYVMKTNIPEGQECYEAACELADAGCNFIFADSFGHEDYMIEAAKEYPEVQFCHATGTKAHTENLDNFHNAFASIYDGRYLAGIVAGMKTQANHIGYVAAKGIPEVIRGINAFTLGVQSVNPDATVEVVFTDTWYDPAVEKQAALELLNKGVDVIAQHQDTTAPQIAAQEKGAFCIGYNFPTADAAPEAYLTAACFNWPTFYTDDVQRAIDGTWSSRAYWEGLAANMTYLDDLSALCAEVTQEKVDAARDAIISGFDVNDVFPDLFFEIAASISLSAAL